MIKRITSYGWAWYKNEVQVSTQIGHEWNGEILSTKDKRILKKLKIKL